MRAGPKCEIKLNEDLAARAHICADRIVVPENGHSQERNATPPASGEVGAAWRWSARGEIKNLPTIVPRVGSRIT